MSSEKNKYQVLMVGCGKMGGALLRQWIRLDSAEFTVIDRNLPELPSGALGYAAADEIKGRLFDCLIVAIKPQDIDAVMPNYADFIKEGGFGLSMAAGYSSARLQKTLKTQSIIRIMPNLPSLIGKGVSGLYATPDCNAAQKTLSTDLMNMAGTSIWVETEEGIDRITAIAGSGPGYVFEFARTYVEAAESLGFSREQARVLVLQTIAGTVAMAIDSEDDLQTLRNNVTSKNGTTQAGLNALNSDKGLSKKLKQTVDAAYNRAIELR